MSGELVALNTNWLDAGTTSTLTGDAINTTTTVHYSGNSGGLTWYPNNGWYYTWTGPSRPIRLTMKEVERLRTAAKRDAKLKAVLAKFTDQIEVVVDFEEK